ncbi:alcohol dehydrogenase [Thermanaeromonas toyohensis ToBE]|uniref:Alcohol dehydrogenase n=1 Tax=Thermanaeromonas toyohensis ToBE TaxID=698762 RepID=A0A1W1VFX3_9FIRM|nr:iron-containing alcohol dehydrogenase [Thermanaeromonas toyohensis]SMB92130.1 alcohol dehydrogenase [Thermanaeromonas toyohensis ToBE]
MTIKSFYLPTRIYFGPGARRKLSSFLQAGDRVLVITDQGLVQSGTIGKLEEVLNEIGCLWEIFNEVPANPQALDVEKALKVARDFKVTAVVALGGGSPMDVAKVVSALITNGGRLEEYQWEGKPFTLPGIPLYMLPTTAGTGSEVTQVAVIVDRATKKGIRSEKLLPLASFIDPELMLTLPPFITAITGMDALTHAIEALVARGSHPLTESWAATAIKLLGQYLRRAFAAGDDLRAREQVAMASTLAGAAMDQAGLGIVHALAGPLCSHYDIPHGLANAILLPWGMEYNLVAVPEKYAYIATLLGKKTKGEIRARAREAVTAVRELLSDLELPSTLADFLKEKKNLNQLAQEAANMPLASSNPRPVSVSVCEAILEKVLR